MVTALDEPRRILIVRPSALGDVCRSVPVAVTLRAAHPRAHIAWVVQRGFEAAVAHHPCVDEVVPFPRRELARFWRPAVLARFLRWAAALRRGGWDVVVDAQGLARSGLITGLSGGRVRIGEAGARELGWLGTNRRYRVDPSLHAVDRMLALLEAAGYAPRRELALYAPPEDLAWRDRWLAEVGLGGGVPWAALAPTARWRCKMWPVERFAALGERLAAAPEVADRVVVLAAPPEREALAPLLEGLGDRAVVPETSVGRLMALVAGCRLLVCNDSAALHMGVGSGRPAVAIFGPTDPARVGPCGRPEDVVSPPGITAGERAGYRAKPEDDALIRRVSLEAVWAKVAERLGGAR